MIEAAIGFIGVIIGSSIVVIYEVWSEKRLRVRRGKYLATMAVSILDEYINDCDVTLHDAWMSRDLQMGPTGTPLPSGPEFPSDLDWSVLNDETVYYMLTLANRTVTANRTIVYIAREVSGPPFYEEVHQATEKHYEELKSRATRLADELRSTWRLPPRPDKS